MSSDDIQTPAIQQGTTTIEDGVVAKVAPSRPVKHPGSTPWAAAWPVPWEPSVKP